MFSFKFFIFFIVSNLLIISKVNSKEFEEKFMMGNNLDNFIYPNENISNEIDILNREFNLNSEIFNVRCFWIKGWNIYDISGLQRRANTDWNFTTSEGSRVYFNFCSNAYTKCKNSTDPSLMIAYDKNNNCNRIAGGADKFNTFGLLNSTDPNSGLQVNFSSGDKCNAGNYTISFNITCDPQLESGFIKFANLNEFSLDKCNNVLTGSSFESCPKINYYIIEFFLNQYSIYFGALIITIGLFLIIFGVKFIKTTIFISGIVSCVTLSLLVYFNVFTANSTTTVWIVLSVGFVFGLVLGYFLIQMTKTFFVILGGYLGYTISLFIYNLCLEFIKADPKLIYWVTTIGCITIFGLLALWLVKHVLIFGTSICGAYAIIRGASLYIGHFPNENQILDLVQHLEWDQLDQLFDADVYIYLAVWAGLAIIGICWQYNWNKDKDFDDYRQIK